MPRSRYHPQLEPQVVTTVRRIDFSVGTFLDARQTTGAVTNASFVDNEFVTFVVEESHADPDDPRKQVSKEFSEVWSFGATPNRVLREPLDSAGWVPSYIHLPKRALIIGAGSSDSLSSWSTVDGSVVQQVGLKNELAGLRNAMKLLPDGRIVMIGAEGPVTLPGSTDDGGRFRTEMARDD